MSVLSGKALHEQLSIIMGALTKAAVAEICEVVDEGYAVLQMEISRSHKENDDLRKKLHLIESIVVRGSGGGKPAAAAEPGVVEIQEQPETKPPPPQHQQRDDDGGDTATAGGGDGGEAVVVPEEFPDVVLIKDEDSDSNDVYEDDKKTAADGSSGASTPIGRRTKRPWSGPEDAPSQSVKSSPSEPLAMRSPPSRLSAGTPKKTLSSVYALDSPHSEPVCAELDNAESTCSYSSQIDPDLHVVHQDCSLLSNRPPPYFSGALMESQSPSGRAELDLSLTWTKQTKTQTPFTHFHQSENMDADAFGLKLVSVSGSTSADCQLSESSNSAFDYDEADVVNFGLYRDQTGQLCNGRPGSGSKSRRFMCSICKKTYATSQNLEVHMRIHTGERPFSCDQCGKKFTQSAHLKSHLSVHTGERPYACSICSRSFIVQYSLKLHMKKCHPNV